MPLASPDDDHAIPRLSFAYVGASGEACPRRGGVSGPQQWLLMAPVIGDILHQSIYNLRRLSCPLAEYTPVWYPSVVSVFPFRRIVFVTPTVLSFAVGPD